MSHVLDVGVVVLLLVASVSYAAFALGPKALRTRIANRLIGVAARSERVPGLGWFTRRLSAGAAAKLGGGSCGGCDNCGSEAATTTQPTAGGVGTAAGAGVGAGGVGGAAPEVRIPVAQIRRRARADTAR
jgi:hypothetical protein